jgi:hypothetical protein
MTKLKWVSVFMGAFLVAAPVEAKKSKPKTSGEVKKKEDKSPPPGDKSTNEGGQGRTNATEDAARDAEPPNASRGSRP